MRTRTIGMLVFLGALAATTAIAQTPVGTSITYQGVLTDGGVPANGQYSFLFRPYDALTGGTATATAQGLNNITVTDGLFTVPLNFSSAVWAGNAVFVQIEVRPGASSGAYTVLTPRQSVRPAPYAVHALNVPWTPSGTDIFSSNSGKVGIGNSSPLAKLHVQGLSENTDITDGVLMVHSPGGIIGNIMTFDGDEINGWSGLSLSPHANTDIDMVMGGGNVGIGTTAPAVKLHVVGGTDSEPDSGGFVVIGTTTSSNISIDNNEIMARTNGAPSTLFLNFDGGTVDISGADVTRVKVLEITGADLAEKFPVSDTEKLAPGTVVMIDAANPGKLCRASGAYNKRVAGVISGANSLPAGTILGNLPGFEDAPPVALSGRVWVHCDATTQAIEVGDLLTTSNTPGYAMTASDATRSHGAVIGKAMTALPQGQTGLVLVLVNLQ